MKKTDNPADVWRTLADRWLRHAEALRARLLRNSPPRGFPRMEFLRRAAARCQTNHYWQLAVSRFYPQIHLAIQPLLHEAPWPQPSASVLREQQAATARLPLPERRGNQPGVPIRLIAAARTGFPAMTWLSRPESAITGYNTEFTTLAARLRRYVTLRSETSESALELTVHRVMRQARRVEDWLPGTPAMIVHKPVPPTIAAGRSEASGSEPPVRPPQLLESTHEAPWARAIAAPPMSIEYLTDQVIRQIDSRMIAMRERMGRI